MQSVRFTHIDAASKHAHLKLSPSQQRIWDLHKQGKTQKEIAEELGYSPRTVERRMIECREIERAAQW